MALKDSPTDAAAETGLEGGIAGMAPLLAGISDFKQIVESILTNPAASSISFVKLGTSIEHYYINKIKRSKELTDAQVKSLEKMVALAPKAQYAWVGALSGIVLKLAEVTKQTNLMGQTMGKNFTMTTMPGGAGGPAAGAAYLKSKYYSNILKYNEDYAKVYDTLYKQNYKVLSQKIYKGEGKEDLKENFIKDISQKNLFFDVNTGGFIKNIAGKFRGSGIDEVGARGIMDKILTGYYNNKFGTMSAGESLDSYENFVTSMYEKGTATPQQATSKFFNLVQGLNNEKLGLGDQQITGLLQGASSLYEDPMRLIKMGAIIPGANGGALRQEGGEGNVLSSIQKWLKGKLGGRNFTEMGETERTAFERMAQMAGIDKGLLKTLVTVKDLKTAFDEVNKAKEEFVSDKQIRSLNTTIEESSDDTKDLLDYWTGASGWMYAQAAKAHISPAILQGVGMGVGGIGVYKGLPKLLTKAGKYLAKGGAEALEGVGAAVKGAGVVAEEGYVASKAGLLISPELKAASEIGEVSKIAGVGMKALKYSKFLGWLGVAISAVETLGDIGEGMRNKESFGKIAGTVFKHQVIDMLDMVGITWNTLETGPGGLPGNYTRKSFPTGPLTKEQQGVVDKQEEDQQKFTTDFLNRFKGTDYIPAVIPTYLGNNVDAADSIKKEKGDNDSTLTVMFTDVNGVKLAEDFTLDPSAKAVQKIIRMNIGIGGVA